MGNRDLVFTVVETLSPVTLLGHFWDPSAMTVTPGSCAGGQMGAGPLRLPCRRQQADPLTEPRQLPQ